MMQSSAVDAQDQGAPISCFVVGHNQKVVFGPGDRDTANLARWLPGRAGCDFRQVQAKCLLNRQELRRRSRLRAANLSSGSAIVCHRRGWRADRPKQDQRNASATTGHGVGSHRHVRRSPGPIAGKWHCTGTRGTVAVAIGDLAWARKTAAWAGAADSSYPKSHIGCTNGRFPKSRQAATSRCPWWL